MAKRFSLLFGAFSVIILLIVFGAWFFTISEGWRTIDAFYFTVMTITTVGYGDFVPSNDISKIVTAAYSIISIPIMLFVFGVLAENYFENKIKGLESRLHAILNQEKEIEEEIEDTEDKILAKKES